MTTREITDEEINEKFDKFNNRIREVPIDLIEQARKYLWAFAGNRLYSKHQDEVMRFCMKLAEFCNDQVSDAYKIEHMKDKFGGYWKEHPEYPVEDWKYEIANGDTRQGYWEWVLGRIDAEGEEYDYRS